MVLFAAVAISLAAAPQSFELVAEQSRVQIHVGKAGALSAFGHEHDVIAPAFEGRVTLEPETKVSVTFDAKKLTVVADQEPKGDAPKVQKTMLGPQVLDVEKHPRIRFTSQRATVKDNQATVDGQLELHGVTRPVTLKMHLQVDGDRLRARGETTLKQTDFGITPVRAAGGAVNVRDEVKVTLEIVGRASAPK